MKVTKCDVLIIGAGLSGLATAYFLRNSGLLVYVVEGRERIGGRIHTLHKEDRAPLEMGATWLGEKHKTLHDLLKDLDLEVFPQIIGSTAIYEAISTSPHVLAQLPPNPEPSLRIAGGSTTLIKKLASYITNDRLHLNTVVKSINQDGEGLIVSCEDIQIQAKQVVCTIPPKLAVNSIQFQPALPAELLNISNTTHTWMGESIKVALTFAEPFWRSADLSGTIFSNVGPIPEMYDHSNVEDNYFALKGFFSSSYFNVSKEERLLLVLTQLRKYYGEKVDTYLEYEETIWRKEEFTFSPYDENVLPHQHNGHPIFRRTFMGNRFMMGGTETAENFPGYMEGAIVRAKEIAKKLGA